MNIPFFSSKTCAVFISLIILPKPQSVYWAQRAQGFHHIFCHYYVTFINSVLTHFSFCCEGKKNQNNVCFSFEGGELHSKTNPVELLHCCRSQNVTGHIIHHVSVWSGGLRQSIGISQVIKIPKSSYLTINKIIMVDFGEVHPHFRTFKHLSFY